MKKIVQKTSRATFEEVSSNQKTVILSVLLTGLVLQAQGFGAEDEMVKMSTTVINTIFSPWVRNIALAFGAGLGIFQAVAAASIKPLIVWGGIGMLINFIPKIINFLSGLGA